MLHIIRKHNIQVVHIIEMTYAVYAVALRLFGVKVVIENNGSDVILAPKTKQVKDRYRRAYRLCNAVVQDSVVAQQAGMALGAGKKNNLVIELGIDTDLFNLSVPKGIFRKQYLIPEDAHVIFSPRSFRPLGNIKEIIDTIAPILEAFPDTYYVFCSYQKNWKYEKWIERITNHVIYLGYVDNEKEMPYIYRDSDIVLSIPNSDSSPRTVYEAMACGSNVIVSDLPWVQNRFENGKDLFVVQLHDRQGLLDVMKHILEGGMRADGCKAYEKIKRTLDYKISEEKLRSLYKSII